MIRHRVGDDEYFQHLHALAITTGAEKFGGPKLITASVPGKGAGTAKGQVAFDPLKENPRAALTLANNAVYLDVGIFLRRRSLSRLGHGLRCADARAESCAECESRWQRGRHLAERHRSGGGFRGQSVRAHGQWHVRRWLRRPRLWRLCSQSSTARRSPSATTSRRTIRSASATPTPTSALPVPTLLPDQPGAHRHLLLQPTKDSTIYVIDRDNMGKYHRDSDALVETIKTARRRVRRDGLLERPRLFRRKR